MIWMWSVVAMAGYGDPVAGLPTPEARAMHVWTNAARVDPEAFQGDYLAGGCDYYSDFSASEQTPQEPLRHDADLFAAADAHTLDMYTTGVLTHDSSDGTSMGDRVWSYYPGWSIAENIAWNGADARGVVMSGWMCSSGHRGNIMNSIYDDLGTARYGNYLTQNMGELAGPHPEVRSAAHELGGGDADIYAVVGAPSAPDAVDVVVNGGAVPMTQAYGTASTGIYTATVPEAGCNEYYVVATYGTVEVRYPETGSYGWGSCVWDDADAQWVDRQLAPLPPPSLVSEPWSVGASVDLTATGVVPGSTVHFVLGTQEGTGPCPPALGGLCVGVDGLVRYLGPATADAGGEAVFTLTVPAGASGRSLLLRAIGDTGSGYVLSDIVFEDVP